MNNFNFSSSLYNNFEEYRAALKIQDRKQRLSHMKDLAERGNMHAIQNYADILMKGAWDLERMLYDMEHGQMLPVTEDVTKDPYLIIPRDQYLAVEYLKKLAMFNYSHYTVSEARGYLAYIGQSRDTGYRGPNGHLDFLIVNIQNDRVQEQWKKVEGRGVVPDQLHSPFVNFPYCRPFINHPKRNVFSTVAKAIYDRSKTQIQICIWLNLIVFLLYCNAKSWTNKHLNLFWPCYVFFVLPLWIFMTLVDKFGVKKKLQICTCSCVKTALQKIQTEFSALLKSTDCADYSDDAAPFLVRNLHNIKILFYILYFIIGAVLAYTTKLDTLFNGNVSLFHGIIVTFLYLPIALLISDFNASLAHNSCNAALEEVSELAIDSLID